MFGVAVFSYIMGNFIEILNKFKNFTAENDEGEELSKFFGVLRRFNRNEDLNIKTKEGIEHYFDYKWQVDKNAMVFHNDYETITEQLHTDLVNRLYYECLFSDFLKSYDKIFALPKERKHSRYTLADEVYCNLIMDLTKRLEPIRYKSNTVLFDELNEFT